ncbi:MAG: TetR/AcrR family transcriptional regulator [Lachnospiraceae bacterium]|nr:TetR/AcrR family transcriptional regulator [Lachnospiraceae bacterium]
MAEGKRERNRELLKQRILYVAAKDFLERGYTDTTMRSIAAKSRLSSGSVTNLYASKEDILCGLVQFVFERQFDMTGQLLHGITDDRVLLYASETVLQLHIAELNENLRELYCNAYSLPKTSALLRQAITGKIEFLFKERLPGLETKDFYKLEIATGSIMRGFMVVPCSMWFTMEEKVMAFLETSLAVYRVPEDEIQKAISFVGGFDFAKIAQETLDGILRYLEEKQREFL